MVYIEGSFKKINNIIIHFFRKPDFWLWVINLHSTDGKGLNNLMNGLDIFLLAL